MILLFIIIYLLIGIGLILHAILTDPYGGLILGLPLLTIVIILFWPYFLIRGAFK